MALTGGDKGVEVTGGCREGLSGGRPVAVERGIRNNSSMEGLANGGRKQVTGGGRRWQGGGGR